MRSRRAFIQADTFHSIRQSGPAHAVLKNGGAHWRKLRRCVAPDTEWRKMQDRIDCLDPKGWAAMAVKGVSKSVVADSTHFSTEVGQAGLRCAAERVYSLAAIAAQAGLPGTRSMWSCVFQNGLAQTESA